MTVTWSTRNARCRRFTAAIAVLLASATADGAQADDVPDRAHHVVPPPAPADHEPYLLVEIHGSAQAPIERTTLCPAPYECVFGLGVGLGVQLERRAADRLGLFAAYDFWLFDSGGVYEIGGIHAFRGGLRYVIDDATIAHPFIDAGLGLLAFGDTASVGAFGATVTAGGGVELEMTNSIAFVADAELWFLATAPFGTRDGATRSNGFGVNVAFQMTIGISVIVGGTAMGP